MTDAEPSILVTLFAAVFCFFGVLAFYVPRTREERKFLVPLGLFAFTLKAMLVPVYYTILINTGWEGFAYYDSLRYHGEGLELMAEFKRGIDYSSVAWTTVDPGFPIYTGLMYWMIGPNTLVIRLINCMVSVFTLLYVYRIARLVFHEDPRIARTACYLAAFVPYSILITINHRKEPIVVLLVTYSIYHAIRLVRSERNWQTDIVWVALGVVLMSYFRSGYVMPFLGTMLVSFFFAQRSIINAMVMSTLALLVFAGVQLAITDSTSASVEATSERFVGKLSVSAQHSEHGGLVRLVRISSPLEIYKLPAAAALATILPYPPFLSGLVPSVILSWANLVNVFLLPSMVWGAVTTMRRSDRLRCLPVILFPGFFLIVHGLVNIGVPRYRETVFPMMLILAAVGISTRGGLALKAPIYAALVSLGAIVYLVRY